MPELEVDCLFQDAVFWESNGTDDYGEFIVKPGVPIKCRWEKGHKESIDDSNNTIVIESTVFVGREISIGSLLRKGHIDQTPQIVAVGDLKEVTDYSEIPDDKARNFRRVVTCVKYGDSLPGTSP